jgi:hypothetical protein
MDKFYENRFYIDKIINDSIVTYKTENEQLKEKIKELENKVILLKNENNQIYYMPSNEGYYECEKRFNELSLQ